MIAEYLEQTSSKERPLRKPPEGDLYARKQRGKDRENSLGLSRNRRQEMAI
jgi:hypothetical protein